MKAQITSFKKHKSKYGDIFFYVFFKDENGQSFKTCLYTNMRNFQKWDKVVKPGMVLDNLSLKRKGLIDADSQFQIIGVKEFKIPEKKEIVIQRKPVQAVQKQLF